MLTLNLTNDQARALLILIDMQLDMGSDMLYDNILERAKQQVGNEYKEYSKEINQLLDLATIQGQLQSMVKG